MTTATLTPDYRNLRKAGLPPGAAVATIKAKAAVQALVRSALENHDASGNPTYAIRRESQDVTITLYEDHDAGRPEDNGDCYDAADIEAFDNGRWGYYSVSVETDTGGVANLGCIDAGEHFAVNALLDTNEQILNVVLWYDLIDEALADGREKAAVILDKAQKALVASILLAETDDGRTCKHCGTEVYTTITANGPRAAHSTTQMLPCATRPGT